VRRGGIDLEGGGCRPMKKRHVLEFRDEDGVPGPIRTEEDKDGKIGETL